MQTTESVSSSEVDEPRACYTELSKLEKEKKLYITHVYMGYRKMVLMSQFAGKE